MTNKIPQIAVELPEKAMEIHREIRNRTSTAIATAFALTIALVWKDIITEFINVIVKVHSSTFMMKVAIAVLTTVICVIGIMYASQFGEKKPKKEDEKT